MIFSNNSHVWYFNVVIKKIEFFVTFEKKSLCTTYSIKAYIDFIFLYYRRVNFKTKVLKLSKSSQGYVPRVNLLLIYCNCLLLYCLPDLCRRYCLPNLSRRYCLPDLFTRYCWKDKGVGLKLEEVFSWNNNGIITCSSKLSPTGKSATTGIC